MQRVKYNEKQFLALRSVMQRDWLYDS